MLIGLPKVTELTSVRAPSLLDAGLDGVTMAMPSGHCSNGFLYTGALLKAHPEPSFLLLHLSALVVTLDPFRH